MTFQPSALQNLRLLLLILAIPVSLHTLSAQKTGNAPERSISGSVLLNERKPLNFRQIQQALKNDWKIRIDSVNISDKSITCAVPGATLSITYFDYPVAPNTIKAAAQISWIWPKAADEAIRHQAQAVVSLIGLADKSMDLHKTYSKVMGAILENTASTGVYMGGQYLLIPKGFYTSAAHNLVQDNTLPIYCWIYFGMTQDKEGSSGYTFGLQEFGLQEMEIVHSKKDLQDVHATLYDAVSTILPKGLVLSEGDAIDLGEDNKLSVKISKAVYLTEGKSVKIQY